MINIKIGAQYPHGACSYYRSYGVFPYLSRLDDRIKIDPISEIEWHVITNTDILYLERPQSVEFYSACKMAKDFNVKLWVDYDDSLFDVPEYNPCHEHFSKEDTKKIIVECLKMADVVTTTTPALKGLYSKYNDNVQIVENAFNDYNYTLPDEPSDQEALCWRGSTTHRQDLLGVASEMFQLAKEHPEWGWIFIGNDVWYITDGIPKHYQQNELPILKYFKFLKNSQPAIQLAPLAFNRFNVGKSNIAWIEGTFAGAVCIGPRMPEWNRPGILSYGNAESFRALLEGLMTDSSLRERLFNESKEYIQDNLCLSKINQKRKDIVEGLL